MRTITLLIAWLSLSASALSQNLVAYYPFNGNANDQTANAINPTYLGSGVTLTTDRFGNSGKAYHFDGLAGSYIRMPADLLPVANRTVSFWFNAASVSNRPMLVNYGGQGFLGYGTSFLTGLNVGGCGCYQTQAHYANNLVTYGYGTDPVNQWIHWVITISGGTTKMYLNGTMVSNAPGSFTNNTFVSGRDLSLGVMVGAGGIAPYTDPNGDYFQGKLDDIRIYDDALTDAQVIQLYNDESVGLVAFYPFNGNANDLSGNGNNGTVNGATLTTDRFGNANSSYSFNGTGDFISTSNLATTVTDNFSMTAWVKPASLNQLGSIIINGSDNGGGSLNGYAILLGNGSGGSGDKLTGLFPGVEWINPNLTLAASNIWVHVAMVRNGGITTLYLNGVAGAATTTAAPAIPSGSLRIGSQMGIRYFNGAIDEVKVFNKALSALQVQQLFNNESVGLVAYYPFNGNANDESGFGRHGTATNGAALTTDRFGNANSAYDFDGINDYIDIPATGLPETNRTVMFWLNPATGNQPSYPLSYGGNGCGTSYLMGFNASGSNRYNTQGHCNSNSLATSPWITDPSNQWTHFAVTISGTTTKIFINGVESISNNVFSVPTFVDGRKLFIGALITPDGLGTYTDGSGGYFKGKLDDIRIYNTALSNTQVADAYSDLVAYYPFNGNANDESGNSINPVYNSAVLTADRFGAPDKAYYFDGTSNSYMKVPAGQYPATHRSIAFWFNADEVATGPVLFAYGGDGNCGTSTFIMGLNVNQFGGYVCVGHYGANQSVYPYSAPPVNNWKHWVVTVNGSTIKMYINGILVHTDNVYSGATYVPSKFAIFGGDVYCDGVTPYAPFFKGKLDEIRVYNNVLNDAEVAALFASESPLPDALATPASQTTCSGSAITTILTTGSVPSTVFNWTRDNTSTVTGIATSGTGNISGTLTNTTNAPVLVTFTITPTAGGNTGTPVTATVMVNPLPDVSVPGNQIFCNGTLLPSGTFNFMVNGHNGSSAKILILTAELVNPVNLRTQLLTIPGVTNVDYYDATAGTPALTQLQQYNTVVAFSNTNWSNNVAIGDVLADYMDAGGTVVVFDFSWMGAGRSIKGRWLTGGYSPFNDDALTNYVNASLGTFTPGHPLMQGVSSLNAFYRFIVTLAPGANQVAAWSDGNILLANKGRAVAVNAYVGDNAGASWTGDYAKLIVNAGTWLNGTATASWTNNNTAIGLAASGTGNTLPAFTATNTTSAPVMAAITVTPSSGFPGSFAYIPNMSSSDVTVIDLATNTVVTSIAVGSSPRGVAVSQDGTRAYIANATSSSVSVINTATQSVAATITVPADPWGLAVSPDGTRLYAVSNATAQVSVINTATNAIITNIAVGGGAWAATVNPDGSRLYVTNYAANSVSVINTATNTVLTTIPVQSNPIGLKTSPDGSRLYVVNQISATLSVINTATNTVITNIPVGGWPNDVAVSPDGSKVYTVNQGDNNVSVVNTTTNTVLTTIAIGSNPVGISISPDGSRLYAANYADNNVSVINTASNTVITTVPAGIHPYAIGNFVTGSAGCSGIPKTFTITVNPSPDITQPASQAVCNNAATAVVNFTGSVAGNNFNWTNNNTSIGLAASGTGSIPSFTATNASASPVTATVTVTPSSGGNYAYIPNYNSGTVSVINMASNTIMATIPVGSNPNGVSVSPDRSKVYIANFGSNSVSVINTATNQLTATIPVGSNPYCLAVNKTGTLLYVSNCYANTVSVINTATNLVVSTIPVGSYPYGVAVSPDGSRVYVSNINSDDVSVINTATNAVVATISGIYGNPRGVAVSIDGSRLYVAGFNSNNLYVINTATNSVLATTAVGSMPQGVCVSPDGNRVYVSNSTTNNLYVINTATNTVSATINAGSGPLGISVSSDGSRLYVANFVSNNVSVVNTVTNLVLATIPGFSAPAAVGNFISENPVCTGTPKTFTISVSPTPNAVPTPSSQTICSGIAITPVLLTGNVSGTVYNWTRDNTVTVTGIAASGNGDISGMLTNTGNAPVTVTFTITPSYTNAGLTCTGTAVIATVTVKPIPNVVAGPANQLACSGVSITPVMLTGNVSGTVYNWTRDNTATVTGIAASGSGNISGILTNTTASPILVTFTITPTANGCTGLPLAATVLVNTIPVPAISGPASVCVGTGNVVYTTEAGMSGYTWNVSSGGTITAGAGTNAISVTWSTAGSKTVTVNYTNTNGCTATVATSKTVTVNDLPVPTISGPASVCVGTTNVAYNTESGMTVYSWSVSAGGTITAGAVTNAISVTWNTVGAQTVFVNYMNTNGCTAVTATSKAVAVTPAPGAVATPAAQTTCSGLAINTIILSGNVVGATYNWTRNNTIAATGIPSSGVGDISGTLTNTTGSPVTVTFTITATANGCTGTPVTATVLVNPSPDALATPASQAACSGAVITSIAITGTVSGTIFNWTRNYTGSVTGIAASGSGNISGALTNTTNAPVTVTFTITPTVGGCAPGTPVTATVLVNPAITMNVPGNQVVCNNTLTTAVNFSSSVTGGSLVYNWVNSNPSVGLPSSGSGNIPPFTAVNTGALPQVATITVTPVYTNGGISCSGTTVSFNITVNPPPTLGLPLPSNQVLCNGTQTTPVLFTTPAPGVYFTWTNNQPSIGLAAMGAGNIPAFIATNPGTVPVTATITVTPQNGVCAGIPVTFTITVNPSPSVNAITNQVLCNGVATATVNITGPVTGTIFNWTNNNTSIGLAASGNGSIPSFTAINNTGTPVTAVITVTATYTNSGITCTGIPVTFTITVNPVATVNGVGNQVLCSGANTSAVNFSGTVSGSLYNWTNSNTNIGLAASGTGNIPGFTTANGTNMPISGTITVTPSANGCTGIPVTFTITVNPVPVLNQPASQTVCNGAAIAAVNFTTATTGGTVMYNWTNSNTSIGLAASGTGNIPAFTATNPGTIPVTATITVTPVLTTGANGCGGVSKNFTITVNPGQNINLGAVPVRVCLTDTLITLVGYPSGGSWSGRGVIAGTNTFSPTLAGKGVTVLTYTVTSACGGSANVNVSVNDCIERHNIFAQAIRIFPNPSTGLFNIRYLTDVFREFNMDVTDTYGNTVKRMHFSGLLYGTVIPIDLRFLASGHYVLNIYNEQERAAFPVIIAH